MKHIRVLEVAQFTFVPAAGGVMTDWDGNPLGFGSDGRVVAGSPAVHAHLLEVIARARG